MHKKVIFLVHGMWAGNWCFEKLQKYLEHHGFIVHAINLLYHDSLLPHKKLGTTGILDYVEDMEQQIRAGRQYHGITDTKFYILGHSMGGLIAQMIVCRNPQWFESAICLTPAAPAGIFSLSRSVIKSFLGPMTTPTFWKKPNKLSKEAAIYSMLHLLSKERQNELIEKMGYESGRVCFEIGFWFLFKEPPTRLKNPKNVHFPILFIGGEDDRITPINVVMENAKLFPQAQTLPMSYTCHYDVLEDEYIFQYILLFLDHSHDPTPHKKTAP
jgi:pimeloyl-ACP methyl ester carboxylesterase